MDRVSQRPVLRLAQQHVNVFRHHQVAVNAHDETTAHGLQADGEQVVNFRAVEIGPATKTTEGDEMRLSGLLASP